MLTAAHWLLDSQGRDELGNSASFLAIFAETGSLWEMIETQLDSTTKSELELLRAQINDLQAQMEVLHGTTSLTQKVILGHIFPHFVTVGQKTFVSKGAEGSYENSKVACSHLGGQMASPRNAEENSALSKIAAKLGKHIYLGMNDKETEGAFQHLNGERMQYSNWAPGEPNSEIEDCIEMYTNGKWNDKICSENRLIVCEL